jgi:hypothetical protein
MIELIFNGLCVFSLLALVISWSNQRRGKELYPEVPNYTTEADAKAWLAKNEAGMAQGLPLLQAGKFWLHLSIISIGLMLLMLAMGPCR